MSTRSRIGMVMPDGKIKSIYCHWDGYPEGVGVKLEKYYKNPKQIEELMELGDISSLGDHYDKEASGLDWKMFEIANKDKKKLEEIQKKTANCTVAYKDRGENSPARIDADEDEFLASLGRNWEEYTYLYKEDYDGVYKWHLVETPFFHPLHEELKKRGVKDLDSDERQMGIDVIKKLDLEDGMKVEFN